MLWVPLRGGNYGLFYGSALIGGKLRMLVDVCVDFSRSRLHRQFMPLFSYFEEDSVGMRTYQRRPGSLHRVTSRLSLRDEFFRRFSGGNPESDPTRGGLDSNVIVIADNGTSVTGTCRTYETTVYYILCTMYATCIRASSYM